MKEFCVDLEIAKELKENGFPQQTWFIYYITRHKENMFVCRDTVTMTTFRNKSCFAMPTSDEILKQLPNEIKDSNLAGYFYHLKIEKSPIYNEMYFISYGITNQDRAWMETYRTEDKKLSHALAKMYINLKKEGCLK